MHLVTIYQQPGAGLPVEKNRQIAPEDIGSRIESQDVVTRNVETVDQAAGNGCPEPEGGENGDIGDDVPSSTHRTGGTRVTLLQLDHALDKCEREKQENREAEEPAREWHCGQGCARHDPQ